MLVYRLLERTRSSDIIGKSCLKRRCFWIQSCILREGSRTSAINSRKGWRPDGYLSQSFLYLRQARQIASSDLRSEKVSSCDSSNTTVPFSSGKVQAIYDETIKLSEEEVEVLGALCLQMLGRTIFPGEFGRGMEGTLVGTGQGSAADEFEPIQEKTSFAVKLVGFDSKSKIKVIKEVRAICGLGLKEAKDLVESAPKVLKKDLKEDQATDLQTQLQAVGAHIEID